MVTTAGQGLGTLIASFAAPTGADNPVYAQELYKLAQTDEARARGQSAAASAQAAMQKAADAREIVAGRRRLADYYRANGQAERAAEVEASAVSNLAEIAQASGRYQTQDLMSRAAALIPHPAQGLGDIVGGGPPAPARKISDEDYSQFQMLNQLLGHTPATVAKVEGNTLLDPTGITGRAPSITPYGQASLDKGPNIPFGWTVGPDGIPAPTPHGPASPEYKADVVRATGAARPAPQTHAAFVWDPTTQTMVPAKGGAHDLAVIEAEAAARARGKGAGGGVTNAKTAAGLRKEFDNLSEVKNYKLALPSFRGIEDAATRNTPQSDINIVYGIAKLYDPTSVVREGEYATVAKSPAIPEKIKGLAEYLAGGGRLTPQVKAEILTEARSRFHTFQEQYDARQSDYKKLSDSLGVKQELVLPGAMATPSMAAPTPSASSRGTITQAQIQQYAQAHKLTGPQVSALIANRRAAGWTVTP